MLKWTKSPIMVVVLILAIGFIVVAARADLSPALAGQDTAPPTAALGADAPMTGGSSDASVLPAPVAMVLGVIGLSILGWRMRKYA